MAFGFRPRIAGLFASPRYMEPKTDIGFSEREFQPILKVATLFPRPPQLFKIAKQPPQTGLQQRAWGSRGVAWLLPLDNNNK
jgi:hypothetical protein